MKHRLALDRWSRKDHFHFFRKFEEPFHGVCVEIDCTGAYRTAKQRGHSFFLAYLHHALTAANQTEPFRYRILDEEVYVYDRVHASPTIDRPDGTFGFSYLDYHEEFATFVREAEGPIAQVRASTTLFPDHTNHEVAVMHLSALPWLRFTSLSHARSFSYPDSSPKVSFGKMVEAHGKRTMPVSIHVHHALVDGRDVGLFVERFQELMNPA
ncbi:chloramphenicol O-acetyltransferase type A [Catalinimonas alkaloidigena]|uniref:Chloramphenicol O-acetyltransferase type A n=1 Tax=Catalinimonas alkaloidigena TaxID=1075417 RepID=A0A1G9PDQ0_9BACT|nr:chloramphenicol acetyltransferase [Catalinimonas alkaloidigena]SDL96910.1 chloramphenicol O-acetyltransferase type A [Catalinimonas alkaloidigena]